MLVPNLVELQRRKKAHPTRLGVLRCLFMQL
jgi:hypothetical protein